MDDLVTPAFWAMCKNCRTGCKLCLTVEGKTIRCPRCSELFKACKTSLPETFLGQTKKRVGASSMQQDILNEVGCLDSVKSKSSGDKNEVNLIEDTSKQADSHFAEKVVESQELSSAAKLTSERMAASSVPSGNNLFKQGLQLMIRGFLETIETANIENLPDLMVYGRTILRCFRDLGFPDAEVDDLLQNLEKQAKEIASLRSSVSRFGFVQESEVGRAEIVHLNVEKSLNLIKTINETCAQRLQRAEAFATEARQKEEMATRARIQAEDNSACTQIEMSILEAFLENAMQNCKAKADALAQVKELVAKENSKIELLKDSLATAEAKWFCRCKEAHAVMDWVL